MSAKQKTFWTRWTNHSSVLNSKCIDPKIDKATQNTRIFAKVIKPLSRKKPKIHDRFKVIFLEQPYVQN